MNTEEMKRLAEAVINADNSGDAIEAAIEFMKAAGPQEFLALIQQRDGLLAALELFMERVDEPPEANCSCHISPPCNDCVENWGLREAFSDAKEAIAKAEAQS